MDDSDGVLEGTDLTEAISAAMVELYAQGEIDQIADGGSDDVIDGRVSFQDGAEDEFKAPVERLTHRPVTAFLSANQTAPGIACELSFLESSPAETLTQSR